ncbi:SWIM zinc finger family protein [Thermus islandicus]|uniref:SWIM zinc finger family protein n=1 Tax=Thermus islandicus TaxID=540988 RepID=UPI0003B46D91|nr:SWIM zinc finger family protein [Thermus islandicus]
MGSFPPKREEDFASLFPQEVLRRGLAYAREGRVLRVYRVGERLLGEVQGSAPAPYRVEVGPGGGGGCTCPYPGFPCKHAAALLYAYVEGRPREDLLEALGRLSAEEAKGLLQALAQVPEVAWLLGEALLPERTFLQGVRALRQALFLGGGEEEAKALLLRLPRVGEKEVLAFLQALLEAPFDPEPYLRAGLRRYLEVAGNPAPLLGLYEKAPFPALEEALLALGKAAPEALLPLLSGRDPGGLKRALRVKLLFALGREEEALGLMREHLEAPEDYLALVERLLALGREAEALGYAEEALEWFGKDPRLFSLADLLASRRGRPEDLFLRFAFRPSLEDYAALRALLGRAFPERRKELLRRVEDPALLARIHLLEEDWRSLDRLLRRAPLQAYPALAEALEERLPEEAKRLYLEAARHLVEEGGRARYQEAADLLRRAARLDPEGARQAARGLLLAYPRRRALKEALASLVGG